jgi:ferrous iron transport protein B
MLDQTSVSVLAAGGQRLTPLLGPMGISQENWPASVGLLTGVLAKEVVVATLNTLYSSPGSLLKPPTVTTQLVQAWQSIGMRFGQLFYALRHPLMANAKIENLSAPAAIRLHDAFGDPWAAYAYCLFVLLYVPCVSTVAMIARELTVKWAIFSLCWSTSMAYTVAVCFWQLANFLQHPLQSLAWCAGLCAVWSSVLWGLSSFRRREEALPS